jgi:hypothetical protein
MGAIIEGMPVTYVVEIDDYELMAVSTSPEGAANNARYLLVETLGYKALTLPTNEEPTVVCGLDGTANMTDYHEVASGGQTRLQSVRNNAPIPRRRIP